MLIQQSMYTVNLHHSLPHISAQLCNLTSGGHLILDLLLLPLLKISLSIDISLITLEAKAISILYVLKPFI